MTGIAVLIPIALLLGLGGLAAFMWSLSQGQFEDLEGAAVRILIDDDVKDQASEAPSLQAREGV